MTLEVYTPLTHVDLQSIMFHNRLASISDIVKGQEYTMVAGFGHTWYSKNSPKLSDYLDNSIIAKLVIDSKKPPELIGGRNDKYLSPKETVCKIEIYSLPKKD